MERKWILPVAILLVGCFATGYWFKQSLDRWQADNMDAGTLTLPSATFTATPEPIGPHLEDMEAGAVPSATVAP